MEYSVNSSHNAGGEHPRILLCLGETPVPVLGGPAATKRHQAHYSGQLHVESMLKLMFAIRDTTLNFLNNPCVNLVKTPLSYYEIGVAMVGTTLTPAYVLIALI